MDKKIWAWEKTVNGTNFVLSSDRSLLNHDFIQEAYATEAMFWAKPLSPEAMRLMLQNSLTFCLYRTESNGNKTPLGLARMVTDYVSLCYLTDVFLDPSCRDLGLGKWIVRCCREMTLELSDLRFMLLLTGSEKAQKLYRRELGMLLLDGDEQKLVCMGARRERLESAAETSKDESELKASA